MLGERGPQRGLFEADTMYLDFVGRNSFYGFLALHRGEIFRDEDFAGLYNLKLGRPSVPPSLLATALVLQTYDKVSDDEARRRAAYDLQRKVALGIPVDDQPFAKSTLWEFRSQLVLKDEQRAIFKRSLDLAKQRGDQLGRPAAAASGMPASANSHLLCGVLRNTERVSRWVAAPALAPHSFSITCRTLRARSSLVSPLWS